MASSFRTMGSSSEAASSSAASSTLVILATPPLRHRPSDSQLPVTQTTSPGRVRHFTVNTQSLVPEPSMAAAAQVLDPVPTASDRLIGD